MVEIADCHFGAARDITTPQAARRRSFHRHAGGMASVGGGNGRRNPLRTRRVRISNGGVRTIKLGQSTEDRTQHEGPTGDQTDTEHGRANENRKGTAQDSREQYSQGADGR